MPSKQFIYFMVIGTFTFTVVAITAVFTNIPRFWVFLAGFFTSEIINKLLGWCLDWKEAEEKTLGVVQE